MERATVTEPLAENVAEPRGPLDEEAFARLPEDVKQAILQKRCEQEAYQAAYLMRSRQRAKGAMLLGGAGALAIGLFVDASAFIFLALVTAAGVAASRYIVRSRSGHMAGILVYGGCSVTVLLISYVTGLIHTDPFSFLCSWLFYIGIGALVGFMVEQERTKSDTF